MGWFSKKNRNDDATRAERALEIPGSRVDTDFTTPLRWGAAVLILGFGGFTAWAAFAPLDAGVAADATVQVAGNRKSVQHLEGGTVEEILVREGDLVEAGQVLVRLNATRALAEQGVVSAQYLVAKVTEARLLAERVYSFQKRKKQLLMGLFRTLNRNIMPILISSVKTLLSRR